MKKATYVQPRMKVVKLESTEIICTSGDMQSLQNEKYDEVEETVTNGWFN